MHPFVVLDASDRPLCTLVAGPEDAIAEVSGECR
jgi:hypothetical protein